MGEAKRKDEAARNNTVTLGWCHPGSVNGRFMNSVLNLHIEDIARPPHLRHLLGHGNGFIAMESGPRIASARNNIIRMFLTQYSSDWLLMLDTDMTFDYAMFECLIASADAEKRPIMGGLCFGGGHGHIFPTMYRIQKPSEHDGQMIGYINDWDDGDVVQVDATGAACLLMHRTVLQKMLVANPEPYPWFSEGALHDHELGEDWMFCLRLMRMGIPVFVNTGAKLGHMKSVEMNEQMWRSGSVGLQIDGTPSPTFESPELEVVKKELVVVGAG